MKAQNETDSQLKFLGDLWNNNVTVPAYTTLNSVGNPTNNSGNFTFEAWIKASPNSTTVPQILSKRSTGNNGYLLGLSDGGRLYMRLGNHDVPANLNTLNTSSNPNLKDGKYHHVAATRTNGVISYYVDGNIVYTSSLTTPDNTNIATTSNLVIGRDPVVTFLGMTNFKGLIDEIRIWNVARSAGQINGGRCGTVSPTSSGLVAYWKCNEGGGNIVPNSVSGGNNGNFGGSGGSSPLWSVRYVVGLDGITNMFEDNEILSMENAVFASFPNSAIWNNAATAGTGNCYDPNWYTTLNNATGLRDMSFRIYRPNPIYDKSCVTNRATIIKVHGGGYANKLPTNAVNTADQEAIDLAKHGYVVIAINYRKGFDIGGVDNLPSEGIVEGYENCSPGTNRAFSFLEATYRMAQDVKAAHAKVLCSATAWQVNTNQIFYRGVSTGACAVLCAAYGMDGTDMPAMCKPSTTQTMQQLLGSPTNFALCTPPPGTSVNNIAGVISIAGAIHNTDWIGNSSTDKIPLYLAHGTFDEAVPYCEGKLVNMRFADDLPNAHLLELKGSGPIYDKVRTFASSPTFKSYLISYEQGDHGMQLPSSFACSDIDKAKRVWYVYFTSSLFSAMKVSNTTMTNTIINIPATCAFSAINDITSNSCCSTSGDCGYGGYSNKQANLVQQSNNVSLKTSPNPANEALYINYNATDDNEQVNLTLHDLNGRAVYSNMEASQAGTNNYQLDLTHLQPGLYILQLQTPTQRLAQKVQIVR